MSRCIGFDNYTKTERSPNNTTLFLLPQVHFWTIVYFKKFQANFWKWMIFVVNTTSLRDRDFEKMFQDLPKFDAVVFENVVFLGNILRVPTFLKHHYVVKMSILAIPLVDGVSRLKHSESMLAQGLNSGIIRTSVFSRVEWSGFLRCAVYTSQSRV